MKVPSESFCRSSQDSRTCYPWRATNQGLTDAMSLTFLFFPPFTRSCRALSFHRSLLHPSFTPERSPPGVVKGVGEERERRDKRPSCERERSLLITFLSCRRPRAGHSVTTRHEGKVTKELFSHINYLYYIYYRNYLSHHIIYYFTILTHIIYYIIILY